MNNRTLFRGIVERPLNGLMWAMLILSFSLFISPQKALAETCSAMDYNEMTIAAGRSHTVGLKGDGTVAAVGNNGYGQLDVSSWTNIKAIAVGWYHTVGLKEDGTVAAVGNNDYGQVDVNVASWTTIKVVAAGRSHTVGLKEDGTVVAAGDNGYDQSNVYSWTTIKAVAAGAYHTVGLKEDGTVVVAGYNGYGQLGVSSWTNIKAIAAGAYHTVGLKEDGTVVAVGNNDYGQVNVSSWTNIKAVAAGVYHTVGLKEDGTVVAVGNGSGQLNTSGWSSIKQPTCNDRIIDTTPPELKISVTPSMLWPPNHQMVTVNPVISVKDNLDPAPKVKLLSVISNEPDNGLGDGDTANDIVINSNGTLSLRAERSGKGSGRIYTITYQATDASGNATTAIATVTVPHNK